MNIKISSGMINYRIFQHKEAIILFILSLFLVATRIAHYFNNGYGSVISDARIRYIPQAKEQLEFPLSFFSHTGGAYSSFLAVIYRFTGNIVEAPILVQHILGVLAGLLIFDLFKKQNIFLAFLISMAAFCRDDALYLEHTLLRESTASFLLVLLIYLMFRNPLEKKAVNILHSGLLHGVIGCILILTRIEFVPLLIFLPFLSCYIFDRPKPFIEKLISVNYKKYFVGFFSPVILLIILSGVLYSAPNEERGGRFCLSFYMLTKKAFYYENPIYPELLREYRRILEDDVPKLRTREEIVKKAEQYGLGGLSGVIPDAIIAFRNEMHDRRQMQRIMGGIYSANEKFLVKNPQIKKNKLEIIDDVFLDILVKNSSGFFASYMNNLFHVTLGFIEDHPLEFKNKHTGNIFTDVVVFLGSVPHYLFNFVIVNPLIMMLLFISLPILLYNIKKQSPEIIVSIVVTVVHIPLLAIIAFPASRYKYPIDPFVYSVAIFGVFYLYNQLKGGKKERA